MTVGATGSAALGGVIVDDAMNDALITQSEFDNYVEAHDLVMNHDYATATNAQELFTQEYQGCLLYTSPSPRDRQKSRMPSSA